MWFRAGRSVLTPISYLYGDSLFFMRTGEVSMKAKTFGAAPGRACACRTSALRISRFRIRGRELPNFWGNRVLATCV
jgi:hypothetical protein